MSADISSIPVLITAAGVSADTYGITGAIMATAGVSADASLITGAIISARMATDAYAASDTTAPAGAITAAGVSST